MFSPLNVAHPTWEYDPDFDIRNHIVHVKVEPPGTEEQLSELAGRIFTPLMDRNKPLWDLTVVDGLEGGRSALILRVHHSLVDGISGIGLVNLMFDPSKEPRRVEPRPYNPPPLPPWGQLLVEGLASTWAEAASRLIGAQLTVLRLVEAFAGDSSRSSLRALSATMPELLRPTQPLPFNRPCSGVRGYCWTSFRFAEARAIRAALGGTINDVLLTTVAGAVSRYVTAHRETLEDRFVRLLVPVNLRAGEDHGVGNEISMMPLGIPLDIADPVQRMKAVTLRSSAMKSARIADMVALIGTWLGWTPPNLQHQLAALPFMPQPVPIVNMVCTNVPGPMIPLYANGHELLTYYPQVPCGGDVGIGVAVSSYYRDLCVGVTYDAQAVPDGELFRDFLIESYEELREAAGVAATPVSEPRSREPEKVSPSSPPAEQPAEATPPAEAATASTTQPAGTSAGQAAAAPQVRLEQAADAAPPEQRAIPGGTRVRRRKSAKARAGSR
jgi:diacylglycerol O-acyltransferase